MKKLILPKDLKNNALINAINFQKRNFQFSAVYSIRDKEQKISGYLFKVGENDKKLTSQNKEQLTQFLKENNFLSEQGFIIFDVSQTVYSFHDHNIIKVVGEPHISAGIFDDNINLIEGTGASKVLLDKTKEIKGDTKIPGTNNILHQQNYEAKSYFQKDKAIEASILRSADSNVSIGGGARYLVVIKAEKTNINQEEVIKRIKHEKMHDKIYDRQRKSCGHHVEIAYSGKNIGHECLETQKALINTVEEISIDPVFTINFLQESIKSGLSKLGIEIAEEYAKKENNKENKQTTVLDTKTSYNK